MNWEFVDKIFRSLPQVEGLGDEEEECLKWQLCSSQPRGTPIGLAAVCECTHCRRERFDEHMLIILKWRLELASETEPETGEQQQCPRCSNIDSLLCPHGLCHRANHVRNGNPAFPGQCYCDECVFNNEIREILFKIGKTRRNRKKIMKNKLKRISM